MRFRYPGVSQREERLRRLAAHYACTDEMLIGALVAMATDRTRGWWDEWRGMLPQVTQDVAEAEHHAKFLREVVITYVPGLLQTPEYARAVFTYTRPELLASEVALRVDHRMQRRAVIEGDDPTPYETIVHELKATLGPTASRDFIHRLAKEL